MDFIREWGLKVDPHACRVTGFVGTLHGRCKNSVIRRWGDHVNITLPPKKIKQNKLMKTFYPLLFCRFPRKTRNGIGPPRTFGSLGALQKPTLGLVMTRITSMLQLAYRHASSCYECPWSALVLSATSLLMYIVSSQLNSSEQNVLMWYNEKIVLTY